MRPSGGNGKIYSPKNFVRAFSYYALSRSLYPRMREDFKLSFVSTLSNNISIFLQNVIGRFEDPKKVCVCYFTTKFTLRKSMQYHGREIFGRAANNPSLLAETMLGQMLICLRGGPKFLINMLPVAQAHFSGELNKTMDAVKNSSGRLKAIICDGNRTNQACFKKFETIDGKPWISAQGIYLLFDFVHLLKNLRTLGITEKSSQLIFEDNGKEHLADFNHIKDPY